MEVWKFGIVGGDEVKAFGVRQKQSQKIAKSQNRKITKSKIEKIAKLQSCGPLCFVDFSAFQIFGR